MQRASAAIGARRRHTGAVATAPCGRARGGVVARHAVVRGRAHAAVVALVAAGRVAVVAQRRTRHRPARAMSRLAMLARRAEQTVVTARGVGSDHLLAAIRGRIANADVTVIARGARAIGERTRLAELVFADRARGAEVAVIAGQAVVCRLLAEAPRDCAGRAALPAATIARARRQRGRAAARGRAIRSCATARSAARVTGTASARAAAAAATVFARGPRRPGRRWVQRRRRASARRHAHLSLLKAARRQVWSRVERTTHDARDAAQHREPDSPRPYPDHPAQYDRPGTEPQRRLYRLHLASNKLSNPSILRRFCSMWLEGRCDRQCAASTQASSRSRTRSRWSLSPAASITANCRAHAASAASRNA